MKISTKTIIGMVIALILIGVLLPVGLNPLVGYNGSYWSGASWNNTSAPTGHNATVGTILGTVVPIMAIVGLILLFTPRKTD